MSRRKKSKAVPIVLIVTVLVAAAAAACFLVKPMVTDPIRKAAAADFDKLTAETVKKNQQIQAEYDATILAMQQEKQSASQASPSWPEHKSEGWDIIDLTSYPLENPTAETKSRADLMNNGMLLINEWHSRPDDFDDSAVVSVGRYVGGNSRLQVKDYNVRLFPVAIDSLLAAVEAARSIGLEHFLVDEGYRSWDEQNQNFQAKVTKLSSRYSGDALIEAAKKEVNYPGTSEYNSGLSFVLRLYEKGNADIGKFSTSEQGKWFNENCWQYGLIFRFPQAGWPLDSTADKSFKTGVSLKLNLYRYVGKGNATVMHLKDFCLEEYIEYLQEHPHIAVFENGVLRYEIYRQYVGSASTFDVQLTRNAPSCTSSLDNMGAVITVFQY